MIYPTEVEQEEAVHKTRQIHKWNVSPSVEVDYIWCLHVIGHTDMLTDTAVTVIRSSSDDRRRSGISGP
jgi:hypothetical protein